ncbi:carboxypeptidase B-like [Wyeomyia smithii]|uniref:carboxypeptidase B-like n=1 Tax=Wyeomyia smithii TaxID=174621 RepID=UPI002467B27B|nr:carboxypeptidase B-like [Wyeomyia smithii]
MRSATVLLLLVLTAVALAEQVSYRNYKVYQTEITEHKQQALLKRWENLDGVDFWEGNGRRIMIEPRLQKKFELYLQAHKIPHKIIIEDVEETIEAERKYDQEYRRTHADLGRSTISFDNFWTLDEIHDYLDELAAEYPSLATVENIGTTEEGRVMKAITISTTNGVVSGTKPVIFIDAGIHAREWAAIMSALYLIHELVEHSDEYPDMLANDWVIIPAANPDGYEYSHTTNRLWRKNRFPVTVLCSGVDLNRNWDYQWAYTSNACSDTYAGAEGNSEAETRALVALMQRYSANLRLYLAVHTYGNLILYPFGYTMPFVPVSNADEHIAMGQKAAAAVTAVGGPTFTVGNSAEILYSATGASDDYAAGAAGFTYAFTLELTGGGSNGFDLPASQIMAVASQTFEIFRSLAGDI